MIDILTVSIIAPTVTGESKKWMSKTTLHQFKYSRVPFFDVDKELRSISEDAVNLKILEDHPGSSVAIYIIVELDQLKYRCDMAYGDGDEGCIKNYDEPLDQLKHIYPYDMAYGGGDKSFVKNYDEPPDFYRYLKTRLMISAGIESHSDQEPSRWSHCTDKDCVDYKADLRKLCEKLYV